MIISSIRYGAIALATIGLGAGMVAASSVTIGTTGPGSNNQVVQNNNNNVNANNLNLLDISSFGQQLSTTGDVNVSGNTNAGSAGSGGATNNSSTSTSVTVSNHSFAGSFGFAANDVISINTTGPGSNNQATVSNSNNLSISNINDIRISNCAQQVQLNLVAQPLCGQTAVTGAANVSGNTNGGSATTNTASNNSSAQTAVTVSN